MMTDPIRKKVDKVHKSVSRGLYTIFQAEAIFNEMMACGELFTDDCKDEISKLYNTDSDLHNLMGIDVPR